MAPLGFSTWGAQQEMTGREESEVGVFNPQLHHHEVTSALQDFLPTGLGAVKAVLLLAPKCCTLSCDSPTPCFVINPFENKLCPNSN